MSGQHRTIFQLGVIVEQGDVGLVLDAVEDRVGRVLLGDVLLGRRLQPLLLDVERLVLGGKLGQHGVWLVEAVLQLDFVLGSGVGQRNVQFLVRQTPAWPPGLGRTSPPCSCRSTPRTGTSLNERAAVRFAFYIIFAYLHGACPNCDCRFGP